MQSQLLGVKSFGTPGLSETGLSEGAGKSAQAEHADLFATVLLGANVPQCAGRRLNHYEFISHASSATQAAQIVMRTIREKHSDIAVDPDALFTQPLLDQTIKRDFRAGATPEQIRSELQSKIPVGAATSWNSETATNWEGRPLLDSPPAVGGYGERVRHRPTLSRTLTIMPAIHEFPSDKPEPPAPPPYLQREITMLGAGEHQASEAED